MKNHTTTARTSRHANIIVLGAGAVGRALLEQLASLSANETTSADSPSARRHAPPLRVAAVIDTTGYVFDENGLDVNALIGIVAHKRSGRSLATHAHARPTHARDAVTSILSTPLPRAILVDATAADTSELLRDVLRRGVDVVLANKVPLAGDHHSYRALLRAARDGGARLLHEATVGAGLPVIDTLRKLLDAGDDVRAIEGCPSGTLGLLFAELGSGRTFSDALRHAVDAGYTEPDPRIDLSGTDVVRKALILGRLIGFRGRQEDIHAESLIPSHLSALSVSAFLERAGELDDAFAQRVESARASGRVLRYRARVTQQEITVGVVAVSPSEALGQLHGTDNQFAFTTRHYHTQPLVISGPGAGAGVTATGLLSDLAQLASLQNARLAPTYRSIHAHTPHTRATAATAQHTVRSPSFEISGPPNAPLLIVLGGISATHHVVSTSANPAPGWWESLVGHGRAIDTDRYRVLGVDYLDGGRGVNGRPQRTVTTHDQADAVAAALDAIGVSRAYAVIGASYGGMVALAFAERYGHRLERLVVISAAHESHPMSTGLRALQRRIVELGLDTGRHADALALARGVAMTTYRTAREFGERFARPHSSDDRAPFEVETYLENCGRQFASTFSAERFLALSLSADLHRIDPASIRVPAVFAAAEGDTLVPNSQLAELASRTSGPSRLLCIPTRYGHDAFLTEPHKVGRILGASLRAILSSEIAA